MRTLKRRGQTLIEVTIATLVAAMTTTAVFSVVLSSYVADARADKRDAAAMALKYAQDSLRSYVSVLPADPAYSPSYPGGVSAGRWPTSSSPLALSDGVHNIDSLVAGPPLTTPLGAATFRYTVTSQNCLGLTGALDVPENRCKTVVFNLTYPD